MIQAGQLLSNMLQQTRTSGSKQIELSPNQVVKGTIVKVLPDQGAIVQIGGMQMVAKMETNLEAGQKAWLQVQGNTEPLTLKVVHTEAGQTTKEASQEGLLRSFGLPNQPELKEALQFLLDKNLPVNKQTLMELGQIIKTQGSGTDVMQAVQTALTKQIPITQDVVLALRSFLFGNNISDSIRAFLQQVTDTLATLSLQSEATGANEQTQTTPQGGSSASVSPQPQLQQTLRTLASLLQSLPLQLNEEPPLLNGNLGMLGKQVIGNPSQTSLPQHIGNQEAEAGQQTGTGVQNGTSSVGIGQQTGQQTNLLNQVPIQQRPMSSALFDNTAPFSSTQGSNAQQGGNAGVISGAEADAQTRLNGGINGGNGPATLKQTEGTGQSSSLPSSGNTRTLTESVIITGNSNQTLTGVGESNQNRQQQTSMQAPMQNFSVNTKIQASGMLAPEESLKQPSTISNQAVSSQSNEGTSANQAQLRKETGILQQKLELLGVSNERHIFQAGRTGKEAIDQQQLQNIKSLLLQVAQASQGVSLVLKETAEQLLQHITGQQLMMSTSQQTQPLTHVMMQIPIKTEQGEDTAFVQVEARKQKGGQLDPGNCRLFFQLDLHALGMTMVDVSIVNRITTIQVYNDQPWLEKLIQSEKQTFTQQLQEVGYQLSILRVLPLPEAKSGNGGLIRETEQLNSNYTGVDLRV
ncbi:MULTISPECIES: hypothetical protein [Brevibacillus]|uniref:hypothetical protein n=1 Tax=Brevibacillus TaxID=55080 RepID=UPI0015EF60EB|nr:MULTISPECIES: hypothetical protein [Brevibacillus]MBA4532262.1 hypothetical protein [Brevibacillus halotolerans]MCR8962400.1 hypothetical protein [Brevibacillus laterosporus]MCZ0834555.1 hypothetical protein [Brevibacillus halotolerans]